MKHSWKSDVTILLCFVIFSFLALTSCDSESNTSDDVTQHTHTLASAVEENRVDSTCQAEGSYEEVIYCCYGTCDYRKLQQG